MDLHKKKCVPCRGDIPPFTREQIDEYLKYLTDWKVLINEKKAFYLSRVYKFSNFEKSLGFINKLSINDIHIIGMGGGKLRMVTHLDYTDSMHDKLLSLVRQM